MSRGWRIGLTVVGLVVALNLVLRVLGAVTGGTPGGPDSSSYATAARGAAAYAELLGHAGHTVAQVRTLPHADPLPGAATVFLLEPPGVAPEDAAALRRFVQAGGRLVVAGVSGQVLRTLVGSPPRRVHSSPGLASSGIGPAPRIRTDGSTLWRTAAASPVFVARRRIGAGSVYVLADATPIQNRLLGAADNAALGLALAGRSSRPVEFLESYHGYGRAAGLSALPFSWKLLLGGLALAALVWVVACSRRFGPPEPEARELPPARRVYVDSLAAVIARGKQREAAVEPVREHVRRSVERRVALAPDAGDDAFTSGARRLGMPDDEVAALVGTASTDADVLALGRALARIGEDQR